jgi:Tfp pilus assembly protein PilE
MKKMNNKGFGAIEAILTVVVISLVGGLGYYLYHQNQTKNKTNNAQSSTATSTSTEQNLTEDSASQTVTDFYDKYTKLDPPGSPETEEAFLKQHGTANLLTYFQTYKHGFDPIICAQSSPTSITIASRTVTGQTATVLVNEVFGSDSVDGITVKVVNQSGLKIDLVTCPGSLGNLPPVGENDNGP